MPRADPEADDLLWVANDAGFTRGVSGDCCRIGTCTWSPCSVLIGNIPPSVTLAELQDLLNSQGELMEFFYSYLGASVRKKQAGDTVVGWAFSVWLETVRLDDVVFL